MASTSKIATLLFVEITYRDWSIFKKHPFKSVEGDPKGAFSSVPYNDLHNEDIRAYIHCDLDELDSADMLTLYNKHLADNLGNIKLEYQHLHVKGFS